AADPPACSDDMERPKSYQRVCCRCPESQGVDYRMGPLQNSMRITTLRLADCVWAALALGVFLGSCGCAVKDRKVLRQLVSGTVTLDWRPLKSGTIGFQPTSPGLATKVYATIVDGRYSIPAEKGLVPGTYKVIIFATPSAATLDDRGRESRPAGPP